MSEFEPMHDGNEQAQSLRDELPPESSAPVVQPAETPLTASEGSYFANYAQPFIDDERTPHFGHVALLLPLMLLGWLASSLLLHFALKLHLYGMSTPEQAINDVHYTIGSMGIFYLVTFISGLFVFPLFWQKSFFAGIGWNGLEAIRRRKTLVFAACMCFVLAIVDEIALPGPTDAPIDKLFRSPTEAWMLLVFGITFAPFFEEMAFRGFLLPALATAIDWAFERTTARPRLPLTPDGQPQWSTGAMIGGAMITSLPFALIHGYQTSYAIGPFVLLYSVSLVLCAVRLRTRSLAASVMVHACYNTLIFSFLVIGTSGFKHLERM